MGGIAGALIGGVASIAGSFIQGSAAEDAAESQANAARQASAEYKAAIEGKAIPALNDALALSKEVMAQQFGLAKIGTAGFSAAGMAGLDNYLSSLGITPPPGGTFSLQQALLAQNKYNAALDAFKNQKPNDALQKAYNSVRFSLVGDGGFNRGPEQQNDQRAAYIDALTFAGEKAGKDFLTGDI